VKNIVRYLLGALALVLGGVKTVADVSAGAREIGNVLVKRAKPPEEVAHLLRKGARTLCALVGGIVGMDARI
jgi:hypothetical protein